MSGNRLGRAVAITSAAAVVALGLPITAALAAPDPGVEAALQFDGTNDYVTFGNAASLGLATFTIETWFKQNAAGVTTATSGGADGFPSGDGIVPLVAKGRGEADGSNLDANYILGINAAGKIAADFEDTGASPNNHKLVGTTTISNGVWYHAAATFDGTNWRLYLNGAQEAATTSALPPRSDSIQHASLGSALTSNGTPGGYFNGVLDEARIWNAARTQGQISADMNSELTSGTGLVARWGLNEGTGTTAGDSVGSANGTLTNGPVWVDGKFAPPPPPGNYSVGFNGSTTAVQVPDANALDLSNFTVEAWIKRAAGGATTGTGTGGVTAYPIVSKGKAEAENADADVNYFMGITTGGNLVADFEEAAAGSNATGLNHPVTGTATIPVGEWHHVAATYDGSEWNLYVDGAADAVSAGTKVVNEPVNNANLAPVGIGRAYTTTGGADGAFSGSIDEVRIWSAARSDTQIANSFDQEIDTPPTGLVSRWGMNEGTGTSIFDSIRSLNNAVVSGTWGPGFEPPAPPVVHAQPALDFDGVNDYVTFGDPNSLDLDQFTIETWMRRDGPGVSNTTGNGGITNAIPLVTHGAAEQETPANVNMNWFMGINTAGKLVADFEDTNNGLNHPIIGTIDIPNNQWHHVAATFDGTEWRLYVDGTFDSNLGTGGFQPESSSIQHAGLGTSLKSDGTPLGFFDGALDEARVWNRALSLAEIQSGMNQELEVGSGLVARWGLNDDIGTSVADQFGNANGTTVGGPQWTDGTSFTSPNRAPRPATIVAPGEGATGVATSPDLEVQVDDPDGDPVDVTFFGREANASPAAPDPFTIVAYPDTQYYSKSYPATYDSQANWVVAHKAANDLNIKFVTHLGDIVDSVDVSEAEWIAADHANDILDGSGVPYGVVPGNHDINTSGVGNFYDTYFRPSRFNTYPWYGGYLGDSISGVGEGIASDGVADSVDRLNKDSYQVINAGTVSNPLWMVFINLEYDMPQYSLDWAQGVIDAQKVAHPGAEFVIVTHNFVNTSNARPTSPISRADGRSAEYVWNNLIKNNCQIHLVLNGHYPGEGRRRDLNDCGEPVHQLLADYQSRPNGGNGWLRYMTFRPTDNEIDVRTYSTTLNQFESDASSEFTLDYDMSDPGAQFQNLGTVNNVTSGGTATKSWPGLSNSTQYEWYAISSDGALTSTSTTASFTTASSNQAPTVNSADVTPTSPKTNDTISVAATASDPDGTTPPITYQWQINTGAAWDDITGEVGASLDLSTAGKGDRGDQLRVKVTASDGVLSDTVNSNVVTVANSAPVAGDDTATTSKREPVVVDVLANDDDDDASDTLSVETVNVDTVGAGAAEVVVSGPNAGQVRFTPANGFDGDAEISYAVGDGSDTDIGLLTVTVEQDTTPPDAPTDVTATAVAGGVKVDWTASTATDTASYEVLRGPSGCDNEACATEISGASVNHPTTTFTDTDVTPGVDYVYLVRAQDDSGNVSDVSSGAGISYECVSTEWRADYFDGRNLSGGVVASECVASINYNFGTSAPAAAPSVGATEYSVRFTQVTDFAAGQYVFSARSDDGVRVLVDGEYVINDWTSHAATNFTGGKSVSAGEHTVVVEYYQGGGGAVIKASYEPGCASGEWRADYFDGRNLSGGVVASECVASINYNFGTSAPAAAPSVGATEYSVRFTQVTDFAAGQYVFSARSDDGVRVLVDGEYVINDWTSHAATNFTGGKSVSAGEHTVVVEYYQGGGGAVIKASYEPGCASGEWRADYFDGRNLSGGVVASECVASINYNFGTSAPAAAPSVGATEYSVRFTQVTDLAAGQYVFSARSDDGVRVLVDGEYVINDWTSHAATNFTGGKSVSAGEHTVVVEYYQGGGGAVIKASYEPGCASGEWRADYFDGRNLSGGVVASECVASINYNFGTSAPAAAPSVGATEYSVRFTQVTDFAAGQYVFSARSDDGVRVLVDGEYVINDWTSHAATNFTGGKSVSAGEHTVVVEYYQGGGGAEIQVSYSPA